MTDTETPTYPAPSACSFCGLEEGVCLMSGPGVAICQHCVANAVNEMVERGAIRIKSHLIDWDRPPNEDL